MALVITRRHDQGFELRRGDEIITITLRRAREHNQIRVIVEAPRSWIVTRDDCTSVDPHPPDNVSSPVEGGAKT